ncbi:MAG: branched-chain amino acid ABC transporter permease [Eubacteriales bacterium]
MEKIKSFLSKYRILIIIIIGILFAAAPIFLNSAVKRSNYVIDIIVRIQFYIIFATSLNVINGYSGQFNIGHAGFMLIGSYTGALLATKLGMAGPWYWLAIPIAGLVTALAGLLVALPTLKLRGIYLAIVTLGFSEIIRIVAMNWTSVTNGPLGVKNIPKIWLFGLSKTSSPTVMYYIVFFFVILCLYTTYKVINSRVGRAWMSIREDSTASMSLGVEVGKYKAINFMYGAFWAGIGGALMAVYYRFISADMFITDEGFNVLAMVILGGQGTLIGPIIGAFIVNMITELFRFASEFRLVVYAVLIILMMWLRPQGLAGASNSVLAGKQISKKEKEKTPKKERV